ncbi:ABC transporter ATP-binding protein [Paenibacillus sp. Leaf72]|uniref:ABC transporter ATP-binding protein n=1 Tax=Paenibacillus sp. Leaf72 TaxID=1736234 RepID=UPI0006FFC8F7|nr:ABC transporter ATP-binding protein [Paenibacillus sp. Leaf72]KQO16576.1 peptide ABC transporter ATP-binding protein [Paenibacillus sp. Leaf72]
MEHLLTVNRLQTAFRTDQGEVISIDDVSFRLKPGETLGIVGESGCGKSVTSLSIMRLLGAKGRIRRGEIIFEDKSLGELTEAQMRDIRGNDISMIFQEPMTSLNPVFTIGHQMIEAIRLHMSLDKKAARAYAIEMLKRVGIPRPEVMVDEYPHALSGGMRQRVMIAMALSCEPRLLIADEPTTALDVTIQAQILELMKKLKQESGTAIMLITHDLGVIAEMADKVIVMYAGQVVEETDVYTLFDEPRHPYTQGLMQSIPHIDAELGERLASIPGSVPSLQNMPAGCRFRARCPHAMEKCEAELPPLIPSGKNHLTRCWLAEQPASMAKEAAYG